MAVLVANRHAGARNTFLSPGGGTDEEGFGVELSDRIVLSVRREDLKHWALGERDACIVVG